MISATWWTNGTKYSRTLRVLISVCCMEFNHYKTWITALQLSNTITSLITSFCFIFDNWYMMNHQYYIYSRYSKYWYQYAVWNLITTRRVIYCNTVFYSTLKVNHIILYHIWYLLHDEPTVLNIPEHSEYWYQYAVWNLITTRLELLHYSNLNNTKLNHIILFHIW